MLPYPAEVYTCATVYACRLVNRAPALRRFSPADAQTCLMLACKYFEVPPNKRCSVESEFGVMQILGFDLYVSERTHAKYVNSLSKHYLTGVDKEN